MIHVVLVNSEGDENIGAAARAMMNMDVRDLVLVGPACDHLSPGAKNYAVHAQEILKNARIVPALGEALKDADLSAAVTRRVGQWRKRDYYLENFAEHLRSYRNKEVYLVFGREKHGLTNEEIDQCDLVCSIPSSKEFPSLNLAQAVMVVLYEIFKSNHRAKDGKDNDSIYQPASRRDFDGMLDQITRTLDGLGFFKNVPESRLENYLKKILLRSKLDEYDTKVIKSVFKRIQGIVKRLKD
jgi:tRNA/rRNA methyltransferase